MDWFWLTIGLIIFFIILFIIVKLSGWLYDIVYHYQNPDKKRLNKKLLKSYLITRYGKDGGKPMYYKIKKEIWDKYRIR